MKKTAPLKKDMKKHIKEEKKEMKHTVNQDKKMLSHMDKKK